MSCTITASQGAQILRYLRKGKSLTAREASRLFSCDRLAARVEELRRHHTIRTRMITRGGKTFAEYSLCPV